MAIFDNPTDGSRMVELGSGDVRIYHGRHAEEDHLSEVVFVNGSGRNPIGEYDHEHAGQSTDTLPREPIVRIAFSNVKAIDVLLGRLTSLRSLMVEAKEQGRDKNQ